MRAYSSRQPPWAGLPEGRLVGNLAVVPASLLPYKAQWQAAANNLPEGSMLMVLPRTAGTARQSAEKVVRYLRAEGRPVTVMAAERLTPSSIPYPDKV